MWINTSERLMQNSNRRKRLGARRWEGGGRPSRQSEHTITVGSGRRWIRHDAHDEHGDSTTEGRSAAGASITSQDYGEGEGGPSSSRFRRRGGLRALGQEVEWNKENARSGN